MCCERELEHIETQEDIEYIIEMWDDTGKGSYEVWESKKEALLDIKSRHNPLEEYGKIAIMDIDKELEEINHERSKQ